MRVHNYASKALSLHRIYRGVSDENNDVSGFNCHCSSDITALSMMMVTLDQTIQLKNIAIVQHLCVLKRRGTSMSENSPLIQPTLQHFGVLTGHLERMVDWYAKVVGMTTRYSTSREVGASVTFLSNDRAHHRLAIITIPELQEDTDKKVHAKLQHVAFEYATIDDLLNSYARIKGLGDRTSTDDGSRPSHLFLLQGS
jgi:catechol 2,3-dioxygenase-like lactoylglutathione lyase family enzyme